MVKDPLPIPLPKPKSLEPPFTSSSVPCLRAPGVGTARRGSPCTNASGENSRRAALRAWRHCGAICSSARPLPTHTGHSAATLAHGPSTLESAFLRVCYTGTRTYVRKCWSTGQADPTLPWLDSPDVEFAGAVSKYTAASLLGMYAN